MGKIGGAALKITIKAHAANLLGLRSGQAGSAQLRKLAERLESNPTLQENIDQINAGLRTLAANC